MKEAPQHWLKEVQTALVAAKAFPQSGLPPSFPWETLSQHLVSILPVEIVPRRSQVLASGEATSGLGSGFITVAIEMPPLGGQVYWLMGKEDVTKLTSLALSIANGKGFSSAKFREGFYYFLATKVLSAIIDLQAFKDLSLQIGKPTDLPQEPMFCIDVEIRNSYRAQEGLVNLDSARQSQIEALRSDRRSPSPSGKGEEEDRFGKVTASPNSSNLTERGIKQTCWGRIVCPVSFQEAFKQHFAHLPPPDLTSELAKEIDVTLRFEIGHTTLSALEWEKVSVGDFILLDRCSFDPATHKGTLFISLDGTALLRGKIKDNNIKIVDYAFYHEEKPPMPFEEEELPVEEEPVEQIAPLPTDVTALTLKVEVDRMPMNLEQLIHLTPGNMLEFPLKPEQGVNLVLDGKKVAKGELLKLGDLIGIKILQRG